jgi:hypothetical protein
MEYEFANSSKKHGVKEEVIINIIESKPGTKVGLSRENLDKRAWIGLDELGRKIEIIAINFTSHQYIIHALQIEKRGGEFDDKMDHLW